MEESSNQVTMGGTLQAPDTFGDERKDGIRVAALRKVCGEL